MPVAMGVLPSQLGEILLLCLDICQKRKDYRAATALMVIGQTFSAQKGSSGGEGGGHEETKGEEGSQQGPTDLHSVVAQHGLWQRIEFWNSAIFEALGSEMSKVQDTDMVRGGIPFVRSYAIVSAPLQEYRSDHESSVSVGQLSFFGFNMAAFNVPRDSIVALLKKYSQFTALSPDAFQVR